METNWKMVKELVKKHILKTNGSGQQYGLSKEVGGRVGAGVGGEGRKIRMTIIS